MAVTDKPGFARVAQAFGGLSYLAGEPGGPPLTPGSTTIADYCTGLFAAFGALVAKQYRDRTSEGQVVDPALYESIFRIMDNLGVVYSHSGEVREAVGLGTPYAVPHGHFPTRDENGSPSPARTIACGAGSVPPWTAPS